MPPYGHLTKGQLKSQLATLKSRRERGGKRVREEPLLHDLQVHQIELEMQNRELRKAQQELDIARNRYADLYDFAPVGYLTFDGQGRVQEVNLTAASLLRTARLRIIGHPFSAWLAAGESKLFFAHLRNVARTGRGTVELALKGAGRNALIVRLESVKESGRLHACRTAMADITQEKALEQIERERQAELAHLARVSTLGAMASTLAHEVAQPVSAMMNYAAAALLLMRNRSADVELIADSLKEVVEIGEHAGEIVRVISDFSRKGEALRRPIEFNTVVRDAVRLLSAATRRAKVTIELDLAEGLPSVYGNGVQLEQVIVNLAKNAIESIEGADDETRRVSVRTTLKDETVHVTVTDTGGGLGSEVMDRLFKPFFSTKQQGHGLGLALCRTIIESHGGRIWAKPGANRRSGATIGFELPASGPALGRTPD
jgi:two-component system, LuxR family, sensor kinase FixL